MAWAWSHTSRAYADAYANVHDLPRETLVEILAEWHARDESPDGMNVEAFYAEVERLEGDIPTTDVLADAVWELAADQATCDNGGFNAWLCPYGCGPHTVAFDRETTPIGGM